MRRLFFAGALALLGLSAPLAAALKTYDSSEEAIQESLIQLSYDPQASFFVPPEGWMIADPRELPKSVKLMVVGKGGREFPPSLNLATERYTGTMQNYMNVVKEINESQCFDWKSLGPVETEAGTATLSQLDCENAWGKIRMIHAFVHHEGVMHIVTGAALKEEFARFRPVFMKAIKSLRINKELADRVENPERRQALTAASQRLQEQWVASVEKANPCDGNLAAVFEDSSFQENSWKPFKEMVMSDYADMNPYWQERFLSHMKDQLLGSCTSPSIATVSSSDKDDSVSMIVSGRICGSSKRLKDKEEVCK